MPGSGKEFLKFAYVLAKHVSIYIHMHTCECVYVCMYVRMCVCVLRRFNNKYKSARKHFSSYFMKKLLQFCL